MPWAVFCSTKCRMSAHRKCLTKSRLMSNSSSGLGAFVHTAAWLSNRFDLEVLNFGRAGNAPYKFLQIGVGR